MKFDYYKSAKSSSKRSSELDHAGLLKELETPRLKKLCEAYRNGDVDAKTSLPCIAYMGKSKTGTRKAELMEPTGLVMIDIDHCEHPRECFEHVKAHLGDLQLLAAHITPSGKGLRLVFRNMPDYESIADNIVAIAKQIDVKDFGEVDTCCKDLSRISFLVPKDEWLLLSEELFADTDIYVKDTAQSTLSMDDAPMGMQDSEPMPIEDCHDYDGYCYNGHLVKDIIEKYCLKYWPKTGQPEVGKRHMFYNQMILDFRNIVDNDPKILHALLPRFGNSAEETWSQCRSICSRNTKTRHSKEFYFFLKDNGYYLSQETIQDEEDSESDPEAELKALIKRMPKLPPVFREYVNTAPEFFKIPMVFALLPIMGTLTSYLSAYYADGELQTTSFISIIYAPPSSGKSFVKRVVEKLLADIKARDMVSAAREMIYMTEVNRKGANEKSPEDPKVSMRVMPSINSLPELLIKMRNNQGYHMFTYCEEMDTWVKGSKAQGSDKNDIFRVSWDNGSYGQAFKSTGTFKGTINLYWNVLITGTLNQVTRYFKDVENGMVSRCSFSDLGDQRFADMPIFRKLSERDLQAIDKFMKRCDENTYVAPLDFDTNRLYDIKDSEFDAEVPWKFEFKQRQVVDLSWIFPHLQKWLKSQNRNAKMGIDDAMDSFRRRCAVRGFRLAMLCYALYPKVGAREQKIIRDFVLWFMDCDLYNMLKLWGGQYNQMMVEAVTPVMTKNHNTYFVELPNEFTRRDLVNLIQKNNGITRPEVAIYLWKKERLIEKVSPGHYRKLKRA